MQQPPAQETPVAEREFEISSEEGLHMRPAMQFVDCANSFSSEVTVSKDTQSVDGKSIMQVTMLAAGKGTKLKIRAVGSDAREAVDALVSILANGIKDN